MCKSILNLTQDPATPEQIEAGVFDLKDGDLVTLKKLLTFDTVPTKETIIADALNIGYLALKYEVKTALVGGPAWLMIPLVRYLNTVGITPLFVFNRQEPIELLMPGGAVLKTTVTRSTEFIEAVFWE